MPNERAPLVLRLFRCNPAANEDRFDGTSQGYFALDEDNRPLGQVPLYWEDLHEGLTRLNDPEPPVETRKELGDALRNFLVDVLKDGTRHWKSYEDALQAGAVVLNLQLGAVELFALPWELTRLSSDRCPIGDLPECVIQYEWARRRRLLAPEAGGPGRVLFAWSDAGGDVPVDGHRQALVETVPGFQPERDDLGGASLDSLRDKLLEAQSGPHPFRIIHLLCHGVEEDGRTFGLALDPKGSADGMKLAAALQSFKSELRCVVLNACNSSNPGAFLGKVYGGVAHDLHQRGIPVVIGSRMPLTKKGSVTLARALYRAHFADRMSILDAFRAARAALSYSFLDRAALQLFMISHERAAGQPPAPSRVSFPPLPALQKEGLAVLAEVNLPIADADVMDALKGQLGEAPQLAQLRPLGEVDTGLPSTPEEWARTFEQVDDFSQQLAEGVARSGVRTVHLFACAPLPVMFHLGYRLARQRLRIYQQHRGWDDTWSLGFDHALNPGQGPPFFEQRWPDADTLRSARGRVAVTVEVTTAIGDQLLSAWLGTEPATSVAVRLVAARGPSQSAVEGPSDAARAWKELQGCLKKIWDELHGVEEVWLAMACPASFAAALGRAYNPNAQKPLVLFNFRPKEGYREVHRPTGGTGKRRVVLPT